MRFKRVPDAHCVGAASGRRFQRRGWLSGPAVAFRLGILLSAMTCVSGAALAHHSNAMFDMTKMVVLKGVVKKFAWMNPHVQIFIDVEAKGGTQTWQIGTNSISAMSNLGWKRTQFLAGQKVTVWIHPPRDGSHIGYLRKIVGPDGKALEVSTGIPDDTAYEKKPGRPQ